MRVRTEVLALLLIAGVIAAMTALSHRDDIDATQLTPGSVIRSSYRTFPEGYRALFLTLRALGYPTRPFTRPYTLLPARGLLIVADPYRKEVGRAEGRYLLDWLRQGNHALVTLEYHPEFVKALHERPPRHDEQKDEPREEKPWWHNAPDKYSGTTHALTPFAVREPIATTATSVLLTPLTARAPRLKVASLRRFKPEQLLPPEVEQQTGPAVPLYRDAYGISAAYTAVGAGGIVWCISPWSFSNAGLREANNLDLVQALADLQPGAPVLFDEYHQGYGAGATVWTLAPPLTKLGIVLLSLSLLAWLYTLSWRFGPPRLPIEERYTRSRAEYLTAMAGLLERARATHVVAERLSTWMRREMGRRLGIPPHAPAEHFLAANARHQVVEQAGLERVMRLLQVMEQQKRPEPNTLLRLAGDIHRVLYRRS